MTWKKHFKTVPSNLSPISGYGIGNASIGKFKNYQSMLPDVYVGHPNRLERYNQYEQMDMDSEVNAALDVLAEFSTQNNVENGTAFTLNYLETPTSNEATIIVEQLRQWVSLNDFQYRMFKLFRNTLKYGDQIFIRDPETFKLYWVAMDDVIKVIVNESDGKQPEQYVIKNLAPNLQNLSVTQKPVSDLYVSPQTAGANTAYQQPTTPGMQGGRFMLQQNETAIDASHVVHISLSEGLDLTWPFGTSILENIFKVYKQKELLEDAIIIYRIQRAPERRVFSIDVGDMPPHLAMQFVERVKNEIHQRRIPSASGDGNNTLLDATYNPLSQGEDYFFPVTADGRGSKVDTLPGGQNLSEIDDLLFFNNKMARGLGIPSSYLPTGADDSERTWSDGRTGTALIQEWRFNQYCKRLQNLIIRRLDKEFKMFLSFRGINIDSSMFKLEFNEPQNFAAYAQSDVDSTRIQTFTNIANLPYISKRWAMRRYLGLSEEEIAENAKLWKEENDSVDSSNDELGVDVTGAMRGAGVTPGTIGGDLETLDDIDELGDSEIPGAGGPEIEQAETGPATPPTPELPA